jgi:transposase
MAMGTKDEEQAGLFLTYKDIPRSAGHPFYEALETILRKNGFDRFVEGECERFYSDTGRPSLAPGVYFRCLLIGYFEGLDSERGIAWRVSDSLSLRAFLGLGMTSQPPDHSTISRTRRRLDLEVHNRVFTWILAKLAAAGLLEGKTVGVDASTLEANAALRTLVKREDGQSYEAYLVELAKAEGIETPSREDIARLDRNRPKKGSNEVWVNPHEPDAQISKTKHGATDMAHKVEHAVDMSGGAIVAVTLHGGTTHDTKSLDATLEAAAANLTEVREELQKPRDDDDDDDNDSGASIADQIEEVVADKGYHSNKTMRDMDESQIRTYIAEPKRGRRNWKDKETEKQLVYGNRRRTKGKRGRKLMRQRGQLLERPFAHMYETGGMRRTHLRRHDNILKRLLIHAGGFNLGLLMRKLFGVGTPRSLQGRLAAFLLLLLALLVDLLERRRAQVADCRRSRDEPSPVLNLEHHPRLRWLNPLAEPFTTGC